MLTQCCKFYVVTMLSDVCSMLTELKAAAEAAEAKKAKGMLQKVSV